MITVETLRQWVTYEPDTGHFRWRGFGKTTKRYSGKIAGSTNRNGYLRLAIKRKTYSCHRLAWLYVHGEMPSGELDHINGNRTDNRIVNLRPADHSSNQANSGKDARNTSGYKGVTWHRQVNKWQAGIKVMGRSLHLGLFDNPEAAHAAYVAAARQHFGEFARTA